MIVSNLFSILLLSLLLSNFSLLILFLHPPSFAKASAGKVEDNGFEDWPSARDPLRARHIASKLFLLPSPL